MKNLSQIDRSRASTSGYASEFGAKKEKDIPIKNRIGIGLEGQLSWATQTLVKNGETIKL